MNVFSRIYTNNEWNGIETRSGPGSHREPTRRVADAIVNLVVWLNIDKVANVGCGEDWWMPHLPDVDYLGTDIAPEAIDAARRNHPEREYWCEDAARFTFYADLIICRDMFQHQAASETRAALDAFEISGSQYLLASTYVGTENTDIVTGDAYRPNLEAEPFNLPPALLLIHDGYEYHDGDRLRDPAKMLGLWRL